MQPEQKKIILFGILDWGLGHATRSVQLIDQFREEGHEVIIASSGKAKVFLQNYFPELCILQKPGYNISYSRNFSMAFSIAIQIPRIIVAINKEHRWLKKIIKENNISHVVSDNCYGLWNKKIRSVFITHQIVVKCPPSLKFLERFIFFLNKKLIKKFDECHVPDNEGEINYSGELSHLKKPFDNLKFIGILSRFRNLIPAAGNAYDIVALLSGPEPHRTLLEKKLEGTFSVSGKNCCIIRGLPGEKENKINSENITWYNHLSDRELAGNLINAKTIICRPGYSTLMDLMCLNLKAILIPTPGQTEQEYLAEYHSEKNNFLSINQSELSSEKLFLLIDSANRENKFSQIIQDDIISGNGITFV